MRTGSTRLFSFIFTIVFGVANQRSLLMIYDKLLAAYQRVRYLSRMPKGAYTRKDAQRCSKAAERVRIHRAGNPTPDVPVNGVDRACNAFFESRGFKPSISEQLQTKGVVIGVKKWVSRRQRP